MKQERTEQQELPERWSAKRKAEVVMRLVRGEDLGEVSREVQVAPPELEEWRRAFLPGAEVGLKKRAGDPLENELVRTRAKKPRRCIGRSSARSVNTTPPPGKRRAASLRTPSPHECEATSRRALC